MLPEACPDLKAVVMKAVPPVSQLVPAIHKPKALGEFGSKQALARPVCWPIAYSQLLLWILLILLLLPLLLLLLFLLLHADSSRQKGTCSQAQSRTARRQM
jgi:hypothetical protein